MTDSVDSLLPYPSKAQLREAFVGKKLQDVATPAAIVDQAVVRRNCDQMLMAVEALQVDFRPHVKTHKTIEIAQMQLGNTMRNAKVVVSTLAEAEHVVDFLLASRETGNDVNVLYGIPLPPSQVHRLAQLAKRLGPGSVSVLADNPAQLAAAEAFKERTKFPLQIYIKVDTGYHRAGLPPGTAGFQTLVQAVLDLETHEIGTLIGFYSHAGHSYSGDSSLSAIKLLTEEIEGLEKAARQANTLRPSKAFILSVGATPTTTSIENLYHDALEPTAQNLLSLIRRVKESHFIELHAGVYPFLDMQQLATRASPSAKADLKGPPTGITTADVALTILVEVVSVYQSRSQPEALIAAGTLALGREPCKSYDGWGIVSGWNIKTFDSTGACGWKVGRISQEHSVLTRHSQNMENGYASLQVGQKLRIWPNHACVAGAGFSWYLVVDSSLCENRRDEIVDVWVRCRGW